MSIPRIIGIPADPGEENPVATRGVQIEGSSLQADIGFPETPVYTNQPDTSSERIYWQYYGNGIWPDGMILCDANTCAQVLFGPILDYYATINQFGSPLGFPSTDVTKMPDGTSFVAFENGVIWLDEQETIHNLDAIASNLVKAATRHRSNPQWHCGLRTAADKHAGAAAGADESATGQEHFVHLRYGAI